MTCFVDTASALTGNYARTGSSHGTQSRSFRRELTPIRDEGLTLEEIELPLETSNETATTDSVNVSHNVLAEPDQIKRIARERVMLMARLSGKTQEQTEVEARLEMLNSRLLSIAPRVTKEQVAALARTAEEIADTAASLEALRRERAERRERARLGI
ncbi:hypothetical protein DRB87_04515 [Pandoraea sp. XY-2]|nr:hypothetical protein DRB87_04515 [Pandoraea sp. XY-2]